MVPLHGVLMGRSGERRHRGLEGSLALHRPRTPFGAHHHADARHGRCLDCPGWGGSGYKPMCLVPFRWIGKGVSRWAGWSVSVPDGLG